MQQCAPGDRPSRSDRRTSHVLPGWPARCQGRLTHGTGVATIVAMAAQPLRFVRDHLSEVVDQVSREHDRVEVTKNGRVVAVIVSSEELSALEETLAVLSDPEVLADIRAADIAYAAGDVVTGVDAVRSLRSSQR